MNRPRSNARFLLALLDATRLNESDSKECITAFCRKAVAPECQPAAICIFPQWLAAARCVLDNHGLSGKVRLATVANFPLGNADIDAAVAEVDAALAAGADEVDLVFPWRALMEGDQAAGQALLAACRKHCAGHVLKVILETGELKQPALIRNAAELAIAGGADFIKTSTGKARAHASPQAVQVILETIRDSGQNVGCKVSGGIRGMDQAMTYLDLASRIMGREWLTPLHFRIGASGLHDELIAVLTSNDRAPS